jgi:hypothetical protein
MRSLKRRDCLPRETTMRAETAEPNNLINTVTCGNRGFERSRGFETVRDSYHEQSLCLSKSRNENTALHFHVPPRGVSQYAYRCSRDVDIGSDSREHGSDQRAAGTTGCSSDRGEATATRRCGRNGGVVRRLLEWRLRDRLTTESRCAGSVCLWRARGCGDRALA